MRGVDAMQEGLFTVAKLDDFVPADHPLRSIRVLVNDALAAMNTRFNEIYADRGRDSIAPEKLIRALLLQVFYSIRSERQLCEQLRYNLLLHWFVGLALDDTILRSLDVLEELRPVAGASGSGRLLCRGAAPCR